LSQEQQSCNNACGRHGAGKTCILSEANAKHNAKVKSHRNVVTLSKNFERAHHIHKQYARLTLDEQGNIVKMVVSR
jgi:hypothetical protein